MCPLPTISIFVDCSPASRYPKLVTILDDQPAAPKGKVIARNVCVGGQWDEIHRPAEQYTAPTDTLIESVPGFVDPKTMNFQLRDDSLVDEKLPGFERIPFEQIGPNRQSPSSDVECMTLSNYSSRRTGAFDVVG